MSVFGKPLAVALGAVALSGTAMVPFAYALAESTGQAQITPLTAQAPAPAPAPAPIPAVLAQPEAAIAPAADEDAAAPAEAAPAPPASQIVDAELACLAKVVVHEAGNQSREGQMAVAQVVMNRVNDSRGRFGRTICGVIMQRGQFFNVHAYNPPRNARWRTAVEIARQARDGDHPPVIGNALFFHAAYAAPFRGRTRVGRIGNHVFYR
ncbi:MAG: N-acetylmuramoyl-L-alanine amidase [Sphingomonadales bacterium]|jgi:spore germination cell wall hydrolase CwlJ-like protein|nr:N-acetylmuramoyl-L-alanine amidase [Sphingomonadales bacterium]